MEEDRDRLVFLSTLGREFCTVLEPVVGPEMCPQDSYEVFAKVLGRDFGPDTLRQLTASQTNRLRIFACELLESTSITDNHMEEVVSNTLWHWHA